MRHIKVKDLSSWNGYYYVGTEDTGTRMSVEKGKGPWKYTTTVITQSVVIATVKCPSNDWDCEVIDEQGRWVYAKVLDAYEE